MQVVARCPANGNSAVYSRSVGVKRHGGGSATLVGAVQNTGITDGENVAGWDATLAVSNNDLVVQVTGDGSTIEWSAVVDLVVLVAG